MQCNPTYTTKEELIERIEIGQVVKAYNPYALQPNSGQTEGVARVFGPSAWSAVVELKQGRIVRVIE